MSDDQLTIRSCKIESISVLKKEKRLSFDWLLCDSTKHDAKTRLNLRKKESPLKLC